MSLASSGKKQFHGFKNSINSRIRHLVKYDRWRKFILERDCNICSICKQEKRWIDVHHIISVKKIIEKYNIKTVEDANNCLELWNLSNGVLICKDCHFDLHEKRRQEKQK